MFSQVATPFSIPSSNECVVYSWHPLALDAGIGQDCAIMTKYLAVTAYGRKDFF